MLFAYNKIVNFPDISVGNNKINETSVTKFLGIHLENKLHFVNHITERSMEFAKSNRLLYKLNNFLPEAIHKTLYFSLIHPYLYGIEAWHGTYQNNTSKIFVRQKKAIRTKNNPAYNEHTNAYFNCNIILKLSYQHKLKVSNFIFQLLHSNIDEEIGSNILINNHIHSHNIRTNSQMSILCVNRSKTRYCFLHNGMKTWNSLPAIFKVNISFSTFKGNARNFYLEKYSKSLMLVATMIAFFSDIHASVFSIVIVFGFEQCTVKFPIISFVVINMIIRNVIAVGFVLVSDTIIVKPFHCN